MTDAIVATYAQGEPRRARLPRRRRHGEERAARSSKAGLNVVTLPKTIDNDVAGTDATIGFATALEIATEAIDRLHSTAHSHHRIIVAEVMGHRAGWLTLGAGLAGGADVILIPEIPYRVAAIAAAIKRRARHGHQLQHRRGRRGRPERRGRGGAGRGGGARGPRRRSPEPARPREAEVELLETPAHRATRSGSPASSSS